MGRVLLVPVIMGLTRFYREDDVLLWPVILFTIAALTDFFDGYLARRWRQESVLGGFLDTTADKLLVTGSLLALVSIDRVSIWAALIIMMREFVVMALRGLVAIGGGLIKPSQLGKIKAVAQFVAIGLAFIRVGGEWAGLYFYQWVMWGAVLITIASGWRYLGAFWDTVRATNQTGSLPTSTN